jgi:DNA-binding transcriptional ArsR family regulator
VSDSLDFGHALLAAGIPVVVCTPHVRHHDRCKPNCDRELNWPGGWSTVTADACDLSTFRPGVDTLAMVAGHGVDVVDIDSKAGASPDDLPAFTYYGLHRTPSGGWHYFVPSTGYAKLSPFIVGGKVVGDYCGGSIHGGGRLLVYLPGSTRPKYPGAAYTVEHPVNIGACASAEPDPALLRLLEDANGNRDSRPGEAAASSAEVSAFLAEHEDGHGCHYGRKAVAGMLAAAAAAKGDAESGGRHGWAVRSATRLVELMRGRCADAADYADLTAKLTEIKPEGGTDMDDVMRWALANATGESACTMEAQRAERERAEAEYLSTLTGPTPAAAEAEVSSGVEGEAADDDGPDYFEREVRREAHRLRVVEAARERVRAESRPAAEPFDAGLLGDVAAWPQETAWRIHGLLPADGNATIVAQRKAGKTTTMLGMARSLLTGEPFLGSFATERLDGRVALLNFEVSGHQIARWAVEAGVPDDGLLLVNLRGRRNPLGDPVDRARLVELLRQHDTRALMIDPFGRAFTGKSQRDEGEVGPFLVGLDELAHDVGAGFTVLAVHAGWDAERSRGSTALEDWPDVIMNLTRDEDTGHRYFRALGRDVEVDEDRLDFDPLTRTLSLSGAGSRKVARDDARRQGVEDALLAAVVAEDGLAVVELTERLRAAGVGLQRGDVSAAATALASRGLIERRKEGRTMRHYRVETGSQGISPDQSRPVPAGLMNESRPVLIGRDSLQDTSGLMSPGTNHTSAVAVAVDLLGAEVLT